MPWLNDPYASEVPLRQVLTGWLPSTRGAPSQFRSGIHSPIQASPFTSLSL